MQGRAALEPAHACICVRGMQSASVHAHASTHTAVNAGRRCGMRAYRGMHGRTCASLHAICVRRLPRHAWIPLGRICVRRIPPVCVDADSNSLRRIPQNGAYRGMRGRRLHPAHARHSDGYRRYAPDADCIRAYRGMRGRRLHAWTQIACMDADYIPWASPPGSSTVSLFSVFVGLQDPLTDYSCETLSICHRNPCAHVNALK
jgi:hypothetical protein